MMAAPGYSESKQQLQRRLTRIEGQVRGLQRMVDEDRNCIDVLTQISAVGAALDRVALNLVDDHARKCILESGRGEQEEKVGELMGALERLVAK